MPANDERWLDAAAGPVVRPYAVTQGRTRHSGEAFDLVATVTATTARVICGTRRTRSSRTQSSWLAGCRWLLSIGCAVLRLPWRL